MKKIILTVFAVTSLLLYSTPSFALLSVSVGVPMDYTFAEGSAEKDSFSGYFLGVQLPFALGLGMDSHKVGSDTGTTELHTNMYNLFYQLPIPVINLILGLGAGSQNLECADSGMSDDTVISCEDAYDKGSVTQWYTSIGLPILPLFDFHLSYRSITSKKMKVKSNGNEMDYSGSVTGIGFAFNF